MTGVDVLGQINCVENAPGFSVEGFAFAIAGVALLVAMAILIFEGNDRSIGIAFLSAMCLFVSVRFFSNAVEIPRVHYLIHMSNDAGYNEFNSAYNILEEICDGYYIVEKVEEQDVASNE